MVFPFSSVRFYRSLRVFGWCLGIFLAALPSATLAQTEAESDQPVVPRWRIDYQSDGSGYRSFGSAAGLIPLGQSPGENLWFFQGRLRLDQAGRPGGNGLVGYRTYGEDQSRLWGGYISFGAQAADSQSFYQLGWGFESLGADWDLRGNAYLPLGRTTSAPQLTGGPFFQANSLVFPTTQQVALTGGDLEVGTELGRLGAGPVKLYGGGYYYGHNSLPGLLGGRVRLTAQPTDNLDIEVGVQYDSEFGARLLLQAGLTWGGMPAADSPLAGFVQRTESIWLVDNADTEAATDPLTGDAYRFLHVEPLDSGGNGAIEQPYGTVAAATAGADTNDIVYVRAGTYGGFSIPDGVQVLSTGPLQLLNTQYGEITLPESGAGVLPRISGSVSMGSSTTLVGFSVDAGLRANAIQAINSDTVTIRDNQVLSSRNGLLLEGIQGDVTITNNQVVEAGQNGLLLNLAAATTVVIADNQVLQAGANGLLLQVQGPLESLELLNNHVELAGENGFGILTRDSLIQTLSLENSSVAEAGNNGLFLLVDGGEVTQVSVHQATVEQLGSNGLLVLAENDGTVQSLALSDLAVAKSGASGVLLLANKSSFGRLSVDNLRVSWAGENGLAVLADDAGAISQIRINGVAVGRAGDNGLLLLAEENSGIGDAIATNITVENAANNGIFMGATARSQIDRIEGSTLRVVEAEENGLLTLTEGDSALDQVTLQNVAVTRASQNGLMVLGDNGSTIGLVQIMAPQLQTANQNGVLLLADNGSTISTAAVVDGTVGMGGTVGNGILAAASRGSRLGNVVIQNNAVQTLETGLQTFAEAGSILGSVVIGVNQIQSESAGGLIFADTGSVLDSLTFQNNRVSAAGDEGILVLSDNGSTVNSAAIGANTITNTGNAGVLALADNGSRMETLEITQNRLSQIAAEGILAAAANGSDLSGVRITQNQLAAISQNGIQVFANGLGTLDRVEITENQLDGIAADGIVTFAETQGTVANVRLRANNVRIDGDGLRVFSINQGQLGQAVVQANQIERGRDGVFVFADETSRLNNASLLGNQTRVNGDGFEIGNASGNPLCVQLEDNFSLASGNFDANLFANGDSELQIVSLNQLNELNRNFEQINNAGAVAGEAGVAPCPSGIGG